MVTTTREVMVTVYGNKKMGNAVLFKIGNLLYPMERNKTLKEDKADVRLIMSDLDSFYTYTKQELRDCPHLSTNRYIERFKVIL
jgi:hypothetical protein